MGDSGPLAVLDVKVEIQDAVTENSVTPKNYILEAEFEDECLFVPETSAGNVLTEIKTIPISLSVEKNGHSSTDEVPSEANDGGGGARGRKSPLLTGKNDLPIQKKKKKKSQCLFGRMDPSLLCSACARSYTGKCRRHDPPLVGLFERRGPEVFLVGKMKCELCPSQFSTIASLRNHVGKVHGGMQHKCGICSVKFLLASNLEKHVSLVHSEKKFKCERCSFHFSNAENFMEHQKSCSAGTQVAEGSPTPSSSTSNGETSGTAQDCQVSQQDESNPDSPQTKARGKAHVKLYKCRECPSSYRFKFDLLRHIGTHKGVKFTCTYCGRSYSRKSMLKVHQRKRCTKKVEKPSQDDDHALLSLPELRSHSTGNSSKSNAFLGEGLNGSTACSLCHMKCASSISLRNHMRFFHKSVPALGTTISSCNNGEVKPKLNVDLERSSSSFECHICNEKFNKSEQLRNHLPIAHGGDQVQVKNELTQEVKQEI